MPHRVAFYAGGRQFIASLGCCAMVSCNTFSDVEARQTALPDYETFGMVSQPLEMHCGSLDCHGFRQRNYRLYGWSGTRLEPVAEALPTASAAPTAAQAPSAPGTLQQPDLVPGSGVTTEQELWLNYTSTVLLQPEATSVVRWERRGAEELLLVSKGRGREHHKGLVAMVPGGPTDRCLISWLIGTVDASACRSSLELGRIPPDFAEH
jgi:hypothetical protein